MQSWQWRIYDNLRFKNQRLPKLVLSLFPRRFLKTSLLRKHLQLRPHIRLSPPHLRLSPPPSQSCFFSLDLELWVYSGMTQHSSPLPGALGSPKLSDSPLGLPNDCSSAFVVHRHSSFPCVAHCLTSTALLLHLFPSAIDTKSAAPLWSPLQQHLLNDRSIQHTLLTIKDYIKVGYGTFYGLHNHACPEYFVFFPQHNSLQCDWVQYPTRNASNNRSSSPATWQLPHWFDVQVSNREWSAWQTKVTSTKIEAHAVTAADVEVNGLNFSSATTPELIEKTFKQDCEYHKKLPMELLSLA